MQTIKPIVSLKAEEHKKGWGKEIWYVNNEKYCFKRLCFNCGARFSFHMHLVKEETWVVEKGALELEYRDLSNGTVICKMINEGDIVHVPPMNPHRLTALKESVILEVSTTHIPEDNYRIEKGDSQK
jgi:mannose-6-phosphate isomerase-like protein (cupin superfamily)